MDITSNILVNKIVVSRYAVSLEKKSFSQENSGSKLELYEVSNYNDDLDEEHIEDQRVESSSTLQLRRSGRYSQTSKRHSYLLEYIVNVTNIDAPTTKERLSNIDRLKMI